MPEAFPSATVARVDLSRATGLSPAVIVAVSDLFTHQSWDSTQIHDGEEVRHALEGAYRAVIAHVPPSATRTRALNAIVDARRLADDAISFKGRF